MFLLSLLGVLVQMATALGSRGLCQQKDAFMEGLVFAIPSHSVGAFEIKRSLCFAQKIHEKQMEITCYFSCSLRFKNFIFN